MNFICFVNLKNFSLINDIKYLGHFFKLLPQEKYQELTANFVFEWLEKNINTYDADKYQEFISQIEIFFSILRFPFPFAKSSTVGKS